MLKITPYMSILLLVVAIGGLWYPKLGYFMIVIMLTLMIVSPFMGRWFCGNLCPRGSFNDFLLSKISRHKRIPKVFRSMWVRIPVFVALMGLMLFRVLRTEGVVDRIGMVFVSICLITTLIAILFGIVFAPRAWCTYCPMGTVQMFLGRRKYQLIVDRDKCVDCGKCAIVCPMHLDINEILDRPDCIKCGRCVDVCPINALKFK